MKRTRNSDVFFARAEALLLMDQGHSEVLETTLRYALDQCPAYSRDYAGRFDEWAREQLGIRGHLGLRSNSGLVCAAAYGEAVADCGRPRQPYVAAKART
ncbi:hypothetical protein Afe04nite_27090 [Asanoa ferruginea]|nr:hypothetical protein Afe04nite_27090 [Asanoa ferruginea]